VSRGGSSVPADSKRYLLTDIDRNARDHYKPNYPGGAPYMYEMSATLVWLAPRATSSTSRSRVRRPAWTRKAWVVIRTRALDHPNQVGVHALQRISTDAVGKGLRPAGCPRCQAWIALAASHPPCRPRRASSEYRCAGLAAAAAG
jgi:hypothetical protein